MNIEKYTERSRGFLQSAQSLAVREGHQQFSSLHLLKVLLDDNEGLAAGLIDRAGGNSRAILKATEDALNKLPKVSGSGAGQVYLAPDLARAFDAAEKAADKSGDSFVTVERLLLGLALEKNSDAGKILKDGGVTPQNLNAAIESLRKGRTADSATAENAYDALKKYARDLTQAARDGKLDPVIGRDEEIRRTRRRQDRHRRRPGAAHPQWRRAGEPEGQEAVVARPWGADRGREIPGRVRGAAEGRAAGGDLHRGQHHPVHRRDA